MKEYAFPFKNWVTNDFFAWLDFLYRLMGLYPPQHKIWRIIYMLISLPFLFACTVLLISLEWMEFIKSNQDFNSKMRNVASAALDTIVVFRMAMWYLNRHKHAELKDVIGRGTFNFECFGISRIRLSNVAYREENIEISNYHQLSSFWRSADVQYHKGRNEIQNFRNNVMLYTRLGCCLLYFSLTIFCLMAFTMVFVYGLSSTTTNEEFNPYLNKISRYRPYQFPIYFPFDVSLDGYYWLGFMFNFFARVFNILLFVPIDTLLTGSIIHLISQAVILRQAFEYVDKDIQVVESPQEALLIKELCIVKCIEELKHIYRAIDILEDVCNKQLMIQYAIATLLFCALSYVFSVLDAWIEFFYYSILILAALGQVLMFSYCCQTMTLELQKVGISVFNLDWPNYNVKMKKTIGILLMKLQKPANLTAGKITIIDLQFFLKVLQRSYSFYTLISQTKND